MNEMRERGGWRVGEERERERERDENQSIIRLYSTKTKKSMNLYYAKSNTTILNVIFFT